MHGETVKHLSQFGVSTTLPAVSWHILWLSTWGMAGCVQPTCNASSVRSTARHLQDALPLWFFRAEAPNQPCHEYKTGPSSHLAV